MDTIAKEKNQNNNREIINKYLKVYGKKEGQSDRLKDYIERYQQKGGGYITLAKCIKNNGECSDTEVRDYVCYLKNTESKHILPIFEYLKKDDVLKVEMDRKKGEPNQKWHLIGSYLGIWSYWIEVCDKSSKMQVESIRCPELLLWMAEQIKEEAGFTDIFLDEIYENAKKYKENPDGMDVKDLRTWWKDLAKTYMVKIHKYVMNC